MLTVSGGIGYTMSSVHLCFSVPFPARETNRQLQVAAFQSSFSNSNSTSQMRKCAEIYFLNSNHWVVILGFQRSGKLQLFFRIHE